MCSLNGGCVCLCARLNDRTNDKSSLFIKWKHLYTHTQSAYIQSHYFKLWNKWSVHDQASVKFVLGSKLTHCIVKEMCVCILLSRNHWIALHRLAYACCIVSVHFSLLILIHSFSFLFCFCVWTRSSCILIRSNQSLKLTHNIRTQNIPHKLKKWVMAGLEKLMLAHPLINRTNEREWDEPETC